MDKYGELLPDNSKSSQNLILTFVILFCISGALLFATGTFKNIGIDPELSTTGMDVLLTYVFVIVALERAAAVYVSVYRSSGKDKIQKRISRVKDALEPSSPEDNLKESYRKENSIISSLPDEDTYKPVPLSVDKDGLPTAAPEKIRAYLKMVQESYEWKLTDYDNGTKQRASRIVFVGGVILAFIGLSILDNLLIIGTLGDIQAGSYRFFDIIVTGGLLGGGSQSFAQFLNTSQAVLDDVKSKKS